MTSKLKVNLINDSGDNNIITSDGSGSVTLGTAFPAVGKVGQVVYASTTTQSQSTSTSYATTGFSASITPTATSSKILVMANIHYQIFGNNVTVDFGGNFKIVRTVSATDTDVFLEANPTPRLNHATTGASYLHSSYNMTELDEPSSISTCTYTIHQKSRIANARISLSQDNAISTLTLVEILA